MTTEDTRAIIDRSPLGRVRFVAIAICVFLNALDGFDVLAVSFAAPGIAREWGIERAALGVVLALEIIGMAAGSIVLGRICDRIGRRPTILACVALMAAGMAGAAWATDLRALAACRLGTGIGIGGMLAATNAATAEYANRRTRNLAVTIMAAGYPVGAILGGAVASWLLTAGSWRSVFLFGAATSLAAIPIVLLGLPETVPWLIQRRPADALARINRALARIGHAAIAALPAPEAGGDRAGIGQLFAPGRAGGTILLTLAYFCHIATFYFIIKWAPKIVVDMGFTAAQGGIVLVWANVGGLIGAIAISLSTRWIGIRPLTIAAMVGAAILVACFGRAGADLNHLSALAAAANFCTNAGVVGLYAILARFFPTATRATGTGLVIGVGRAGAALSPILAGRMFEDGRGLPTVALAMASGALIAAIMLTLLARRQRT